MSGGDSVDTGSGDAAEVKRLQQELAKAKCVLDAERALREGDSALSSAKLRAMPLDVRAIGEPP